MSRGKAVAWICLVALVAAIAACGLLPWPVAATSVQSGLNVYSGSILRWAAPDAATFRALPWPSLHFYNARLGDRDLNLLSAPEARVDLSLSGLLWGRFVPIRTTLKNPVVTIDLNAPPFSATHWPDRIVNVRAALAPLVSITLLNGVVRIIDKPHDFDTVIDDVDGRIEGIAATETLTVSASAVWRETPLSLSGSFANAELTAGGASALAFGIESSIADFAVTGGLVLNGRPSLNGDLALSVPSLSALARVTGLAKPPYILVEDIAIVSKIKASPDDLTLGDATITSAGQVLQGALQISSFRGRAVVSGSLDSKQLTVEPLIAAWGSSQTNVGKWSDRLFPRPTPLDFDVDLRLSAASLDIYGRTLTNAAVSTLVKGRELSVNLIEAGTYGGRLEGEARLSQSDGSADFHIRAKLSDADIGAVFSDLEMPVVTGSGTAELAIATSGRTPAEAIARLAGTASLEAQQGSILQINLEEALRRSQRHIVDATREIETGQTAFDRISISALIADGIVRVVSGRLFAHGLSSDIAGVIDLPSESLDLNLAAVQTGASGEVSPDAARLSVGVTGPWSAPTIQIITPQAPK